MRSLDKRRVDYWTPDVPPSKPDDLPKWLHTQLTNLSNALHDINMLHLERAYSKYSDRAKARDGDIILADAGVEGIKGGIYWYDMDHWARLEDGQ